MLVRVPVSVGELLDKLAILRIKSRRMADEAKRANVRREIEALQPEVDRLGLEDEDLRGWMDALADVNGQLWDIEDDIRACEARGDFGDEFVRLARAVYRTNDERARIKRVINDATGSELVEEKSYKDPDGAG